MARKPARSKRSRGRQGRKNERENAKEKATPIWLNPLAIASLVLVLALGGVGAWLTLTFEETVRERRNGRLTRAGGTDQGHRFSGCNPEANVFENRPV